MWFSILMVFARENFQNAIAQILALLEIANNEVQQIQKENQECLVAFAPLRSGNEGLQQNLEHGVQGDSHVLDEPLQKEQLLFGAYSIVCICGREKLEPAPGATFSSSSLEPYSHKDYKTESGVISETHTTSPLQKANNLIIIYHPHRDDSFSMKTHKCSHIESNCTFRCMIKVLKGLYAVFLLMI